MANQVSQKEKDRYARCVVCKEIREQKMSKEQLQEQNQPLASDLIT